jgi:GNAT superfamily N-acetyltransferase
MPEQRRALLAFVIEMIVLEPLHGNGIGRRLLAHLVAEAHSRGVEDVPLFAARGRTSFDEWNGLRACPADGPGTDLAGLR